MTDVETARLHIRRLDVRDAAFIVELLNEPSFLHYIGDRGVRTLDDARAYIAAGPQASYRRHGFGLCAVVPRETGMPAGICGIMKKDWLEHPDLGYAFLPGYWSRGYASEAAAAILAAARARADLHRIVAVATPDNDASARVLRKLGFHFERPVLEPASGDELHLFAVALTPGARAQAGA